jgi:predicted pyridoxine 5'-phosphate oxidase superfamily flavin-nucleotide-binding protein
MAKLNEEVKGVISKSKGFALATADKKGNPNVVPIAFGKVISDTQIVLIDVFMDKTIKNIQENQNIAVSVWDMETLTGYQLKGRAAVETSGKVFDDGVQLVKSMMPQLNAKGAVIMDIETIYITSPGPDVGKVIS